MLMLVLAGCQGAGAPISTATPQPEMPTATPTFGPTATSTFGPTAMPTFGPSSTPFPTPPTPTPRSPKGQIVFGAYPCMPGGDCSPYPGMEDDFSLYIINSDGTGMRPVTGEELLQRGLLFRLPFVPDKMVERAEKAGIFRRHANAAALFNSENIRWLPDGSAWIERGEDGLYVVRTDGTGSTKVAEGEIYDFDLSPDGRTIAYAEGTTIYSVEIDGSNRRELARIRARGVGDVYWSPEGDLILISTTRGPDDRWDDLYLVDFNTRQIQSLFHLANPAMSSLHNPQWSSDGRHVEFLLSGQIFLVGQKGPITLFSITGNGDDLEKIVEIPYWGYIERTVWSPDRHHIAFAPGFYPDEGLYMLDLGSGYYWQILSGYVLSGPMLWVPEP